MRKTVIIAVIVGALCFTGGYFLSVTINKPYDSILSDSLHDYSSGTALVTIDNQVISKEYLDRRVALYKKYIAGNSGQSPLMQDKLLKKLIDNYIVLNEIQKTHILRSQKAQNYLWIYLEEAMVDYYLDFMVSLHSKKGISMNESDMKKFYLKNKAMFDKKGISEQKAMEIVKNEISNLNRSISDKYKNLLRQIQLGKIKKGKKIEIKK